MNEMVAVTRAVLAKWNRKCVETIGDNPGSVEFTYPNDYTEGMELSCQVTVDPNRRVTAVLYKMEHRIGEFLVTMDGGTPQGPWVESLMGVLETFNQFCSRCDEDLAFAKTLVCRGPVNRASTFSSRAFLA